MGGGLEVDPQIVELDYLLGRFLDALKECGALESIWVFKGGTALRKCYYEDYRFSEDMDFTLSGDSNRNGVMRRLHCAANLLSRFSEYAVEVTDLNMLEEPDEPSLEGRAYYRSQLGSKNLRTLRIHLSLNEVVFTETINRPVHHPFGDGPSLGPVVCYTLDEMLAEKLRAVAGQRRFAIARDIFDISEIVRRKHSPGGAIQIFPGKCRAKGLKVDWAMCERLASRREEFRASWEGGLEYLIPVQLRREGFDRAWARAVDTLRSAVEASR